MRRKNKILSFFVVILAVIAVLGLAGTLTKGFTKPLVGNNLKN